jgi:thiol-disulfide isomerase/thioredoxin
MGICMVGGRSEQEKGAKIIWTHHGRVFNILFHFNTYFMKPLVLAIFLVVFAAGCRKDAASSDAVVAEQNDLPALRLTLADGKRLTGRELSGHTVLVLFQPDCDHCQREAEQIAAFSKSFKNYEVYFISSAPMTEILKFADTYHLNDKPNFHFAETPFDDVVSNLGPIETPSLYIYSGNRKLVQSFNGEVAMEVIVKYL